jgi:hypothetical protein
MTQVETSAREPEEQAALRERPSERNQTPAPTALQFVRPLAVFAVATMILGRALGPSIRGLAVGLGRVGELIELLGGTTSQLFLIAATVTAMALVLTSTRARLPVHLRVGCVLSGGAVILGTLTAATSRVPVLSSVAIGTAACALALTSAWDGLRVPYARAVAVGLGFVALGGIVRLVAVALVMREVGPPPERLDRIAHGLGTVGALLDAGAIAVTLSFIASRSRKLTSPLTIVALGVAMLCTRYALVGASDDAGAVSVLLGRAARALSVRPEPLLPPAVSTFIAFLAPATALAALLTPTLTPALSGAVALLLLSHGAPDVPLCALSLALAALAVPLATRDQRGLWASISKSGTADAPREPQAPSRSSG